MRTDSAVENEATDMNLMPRDLLTGIACLCLMASPLLYIDMYYMPSEFPRLILITIMAVATGALFASRLISGQMTFVWHPIQVAVLLLLLLAEPSGTLAQTAGTADYFPLAVGNTWTYFTVLHPPSTPPDTLWKGTYSVTETISIGDTLYYVSTYPFALADTLRMDGAGRIWARVQEKDVLLFDFTRVEEEVYHFTTPRVPGVTFEVTIAQSQTVDVGVHAGHDPQERALARAVVSDHADLGARQKRQGDRIQDHLAVVGLRHLAQDVDVLAHGTS